MATCSFTFYCANLILTAFRMGKPLPDIFTPIHPWEGYTPNSSPYISNISPRIVRKSLNIWKNIRLSFRCLPGHVRISPYIVWTSKNLWIQPTRSFTSRYLPNTWIRADLILYKCGGKRPAVLLSTQFHLHINKQVSRFSNLIHSY